jgi:lipoyl(octanoyl) transferase
MDKQLHGITPEPLDTGKLGKTSPSGNVFNAFIIEPRDLVPFSIAWGWQKDWQKSLLTHRDLPPAIWLLQHPNCYTLGSGSSESNLCFPPDKPPADLYRINRGGEVTHHLPGQLVVYLVMDLLIYKQDLSWYLRQLEQVVLEVLRELGLLGERIQGFTGVWLDGFKVSSIGIGCRRWVTQHGLALNVNCDLTGFDQIVPCGLSGTKVGRLDAWLPGLQVQDVQPLMRKSLANRFGLKWTEQSFLPKF